MRKVLKISIFLFFSAIVLSVALFFGIKYFSDRKEENKENEQTFDRTPLDADSVFGDYIFEKIVRETLSLPEGEIDFDVLAEITELDLSFEGASLDENNKIQSLSGLKHFTGLKKLIVDNNMFSSLSGIEACSGLEYLSAQGCRIYSATELENLTELRFLKLKNNEITDTSFLSNLTNLEYLNLSGCPISDLEFLAETSLPNLKELYIASTGFTEMEWIYLLSGLEKLDVS